MYASGAGPSSPVIVGWSTRNRPACPGLSMRLLDAHSLPRPAFTESPRRTARDAASIHGLRSCGVRSRCRSTSRRAVVPRSDEIGNRSPGAGIVTPRQSNPLCRCAPSAGEVNIILVVTSILRVRNKVVDVGVSLTRRPYTARRLASDHWSTAPRTTALQSALNC